MVLSRFFRNLNSSFGYIHFPVYKLESLGFIIKYQPIKGKGFLFNLVFSITISGIITSIDIYHQNLEVSYWVMIAKFLINTLYVTLGLIVFGYPIITLLKKIDQMVPWTSSRYKRAMVGAPRLHRSCMGTHCIS